MHQNQQIRVIQAAPGKGKTYYICNLIKNRIGNERFIVALRDKKCADTFEEDVKKELEDDQEDLVRKIYAPRATDEDEWNSVTRRLNIALEDDSVRLIIICQKSLDTFPNWADVKGRYTLFIDELFEAAYFHQKKLSAYLADDLGINRETLGLTNLEELKAKAASILEQSKGNSELHAQVLALLESLTNAQYISVKVHHGSYKITTFRESKVFENLRHFRCVYLAGMIIEGTLPHLIASAKGFEFVPSDWEKQGEPFSTDDKVTIIPLMKRVASATFLNDPKGAKVKNFERLFLRAADILNSKLPAGKIHLMLNKDIEGVRDRMCAVKRNCTLNQIEDMGFNTHGQHDWQKGRKFALLFTSRWNRDYDLIGEAYAKDLGIDLEKLISAYETTMQLEPTAQAATRGQVRKSGNKSSWIVVLDTRTAEYLKNTILHRSKIDSSYLAELSEQSVSMLPSNAGIKSLMKRKWELSDTQAKAVERRCKKVGATDRLNPDHIQIAERIVKELYPEVVTASEYVLS